MENKKVKGRQLSDKEILNLKEGMEVWLEDNMFTKEGTIAIVTKNEYSNNGLALNSFSRGCKWYIPSCVSIHTDYRRYNIKIFELVDEVKIDYKIGDKVVPHSKSIGNELENSVHWKQAIKDNQPYLFVVGVNKESDGIELVLASKKCNFGGDYFKFSDVTPYIEKEKLADNKSKVEIVGIKGLEGVKGEYVKIGSDVITVLIDGKEVIFNTQNVKILTPINIHKDMKGRCYVDGEYVTYEIHKNKTIVTLPKGFEGISICHEEDKFDRKFAIELAYWRAKEKEAMRLLNKSREKIGKLVRSKN